MKRIGILTSGGDCPGLNAVIRAVVKCSTRKGWDVYGIPYGTDGFIEEVWLNDLNIKDPEELKLKEHGYDIPGLLPGLDVLQFLSGSVLGSLSKTKFDPHNPESATKIIEGYRRLNLDALILVGGDGTLEIVYNNLVKKGDWNIVAVPKTIDNDVPFTERSIGFDTAVGTVTKALYDLTFTAASHGRVLVVEVMGRDAGHLALHSGIAGGADIILIPEVTPKLTDRVMINVCKVLDALRAKNRRFALIVVSEGVGDIYGKKINDIGHYLTEKIEEYRRILCTTEASNFCNLQEKLDIRTTVLGHVQRSGTPSSFDRLLATSFGVKAVELIAQEKFNNLVVWKNGKVEYEPIEKVMEEIRKHQKDNSKENVCSAPVKADDFMLKTARSLGVYMGDDHLPWEVY